MKRRLTAFLSFTPLAVLAAACLLVREQYPLSHLPMYSTFSRSTYYVYLADGAGQSIRARELVGMTTPTLKKVYDREIGRETKRLRVRRRQLTAEQKRAVGERLLFQLKNSPPARAAGARVPATLRLYHVDIELTHGRIDKRTTLIAEAR